MLTQLLTRFARRKNPDFRLDPAISSGMIWAFSMHKLGWWLRSWMLLFRGKVPKMWFLGPRVRIQYPGNMQIGRYVNIHEGAYLSALGKYPLVIGDHVNIGAYSRLVISQTFHDLGAYIRIGDRVGLGDFAHLGGAGGLEIGADCIIGAYLSCHPENHVFSDPEVPIRLQGHTRKGIKIGRNCWIGAKVTILDGVEIGDNCVLAAGAVITKSMPANSVIGGVPAKVLKTRSTPIPKASDLSMLDSTQRSVSSVD
ncbi:DapH/DapD/GlmU-related protein [Pontibacter sp. G13]|uniref:acyltransferase n=1 Tax=Pontibacter sp. G13 TaxID=3074898 RepID=UPI00288B4DBD|nr:DapH/DapD/GlmU-related protein [Pontibacter sp. G13]WNJ19310.1 DapH/DapD/GlmU-related protein [Pontibacter sp. G13]